VLQQHHYISEKLRRPKPPPPHAFANRERTAAPRPRPHRHRGGVAGRRVRRVREALESWATPQRRRGDPVISACECAVAWRLLLYPSETYRVPRPATPCTSGRVWRGLPTTAATSSW